MKKLKYLPLLLTPFAIGCLYDPELWSLRGVNSNTDVVANTNNAGNGQLAALAAMNSFNQNMQQSNQQYYNRLQQIASEPKQSYAPVYIPPSYSRRDSALQSLQKQQEIDAYNQRTRALSQPQQLNLNHSGTINHNVYGYGY